MQKFIVALLAWLLGVFAPGYRQAPGHHGPGRTGLRATARGVPQYRPSRPPFPVRLHTVLDGETAATVRPYLIAWERERAAHEQALQHWRRTALVLAADFGIDPTGT